MRQIGPSAHLLLSYMSLGFFLKINKITFQLSLGLKKIRLNYMF